MLRAAGGALALILLTVELAGGIQLRSGTDPSPPGTVILAIEDARAPTAPQLGLLFDAATGTRASTADRREQLAAIRALGRLGRPEAVTRLVTLTSHRDAAVRTEAATALMLLLRAGVLATDDQLFKDTIDRLLSMPAVPAGVLGGLPYTRPADVQTADALLRARFEKQSDPPATPIRALEALARRQRKLAPLSDDTVAALRLLATRLVRTRDPAPRRNAMAALLAAGVVEDEIVEIVLGDDDPEVRRLAALALSTSGTTGEPGTRTELTRYALRDRSPLVRYEALRAWARREASTNGCGPLLDALDDESQHVVLAAMDALGERCRDDGDITDRLVSEARTPPSTGPWHREVHALVALAQRSRERAAISLGAFVGHPVWQVRMYAVRAAMLLEDAAAVERLAFDPEPNVRDAALAPMRALQGDRSEAAFVSALGERDYQLLRTAAIALKGATSTRHLRTALVGALERVTAEKKDTSRDTRRALIERITELGDATVAGALEPLARDFDPVIAAAASAAHAALAGRPLQVRPVALPRPPVSGESELRDFPGVRVSLDNGRSFEIAFLPGRPLSLTRLRRLVRTGYYTGLTFHRVVPNFVVQGGSPGANEYEGDGPFMRDELTLDGHERGTVGISTRGRDTGDAQIFINLVDNPRLDMDYTIVGRVPARDMPAVDSIAEGSRIISVTPIRRSR
jgi:cyclophilin family peptidyl-prolyl cis-trans isomerase/HEAT repeat protein